MDRSLALDALLELAVVPSFSRIGPLVRRRIDHWSTPAPGSLAGKTALVTGPTSGLGRATADAFARLGARVILVGRDAGRLESVRRELADRHGEADRVRIVVADLGSLSDVRAAVDAVVSSETRLDVIIDSAGAIEPGGSWVRTGSRRPSRSWSSPRSR